MRHGLYRPYRRRPGKQIKAVALSLVSVFLLSISGAQADTQAMQPIDNVPGATNPDAPIELPSSPAQASQPDSQAQDATSKPASHLTFNPPRTTGDLSDTTDTSAGGTVGQPLASPSSVDAVKKTDAATPKAKAESSEITGMPATSGLSPGLTSVLNAPLTSGMPPLDSSDDLAKEVNKALAQNPPLAITASRQHLPPVTGTVEMRKAFKLVVKEQLIHNISFRDTPVKEVIGEIGRRGNLNLIIDKSAVGTITGEMHDVTLNEAMDSVLAAAGLHTRVLDNNTVIIASPAALVALGLGRPMARAFKLSYAHPWDIATILQATVFNKGVIPFTPTSKLGGQSDPSLVRDPTNKMVKTSSQERTIDGVGFNNAATDPGSQQIRAFQEVNQDYQIDQNGGGAIVIPDTKNRQVIVVGSVDDIAIAEEAIHLLDRRPKEVHIQASLIEVNNQGIRELGTNLSLQGNGASTTILGNSTAPLVQYLPGLGSNLTSNPVNFINSTPGGTPPLVGFSNNVTNNNTSTAFSGLLGSVVPFVGPTIGGVTAASVAQSAFNFLTLANSAGGKANIATAPTALNVSLNLLLQTNKAKIIANPSVVVSDNTEALITIANEVIHKVTSTVSLGVVTTNVELTKAGVFLNVLPKVTEDGFITMRLRPQVSAPITGPVTFGTTTVTLLSIRDVMSQEVRIKDGQTLVIGGLFQEQEAANLAKVPYLSEAPVLGALFRNTLKGRSRTELMLLITPKAVEDDPTSPSTSLSDQAPAHTM